MTSHRDFEAPSPASAGADSGHANAGRAQPGGLARVAGFVIIALALGLLVVNGLSTASNCGGLRAPRSGDQAPAFSLETLKGKTVSLADYRGKVVLLDFWATWCPPCVAKYPALEALQRQHGPRGFQVLAISLDQNVNKLREFVAGRARERSSARRPADSGIVVLRANGRVAADYGIHTLPSVALVDRRGRLRYTHVGRGGESDLRAHLQAALARDAEQR